MRSATKAIIPVAGYGSRRLPITKSIEKCMLPLGNRPVIDYIVSDCVKAGITDIYFIVSGQASQLRSFYRRNVELEEVLRANGKTELADMIIPPTGVTFHFIEQDLSDGRYGTTIPVWLCRDYVSEDELVLVMMGDDVTYAREGGSDIERLVGLGSPAILGLSVEEGDLSSYGVIAQSDEGIFTSIVEKPAPGTEPSRIINVSKYVLPGTFMSYADASVQRGANAGGEFFITDPINDMVADGTALKVVQARGTYLDTGTVEAWVHANQWLLENS